MGQCPDPPSGQPAIDISFWDRPTSELVAEGIPIVAVWATKNAALNLGCSLDFPPPEWSDDGWHEIDTAP